MSSFVSYAAGSSVQKQDNFKWSYWLSVQTMVSSSTAKLDVCELFLAKWSFLILNHSTNPLEINLSLPLPQNIVARLRLIMLIFFVLITKKLWEQKPIPVNSLFHFCILSGFWSPWLLVNSAPSVALSDVEFGEPDWPLLYFHFLCQYRLPLKSWKQAWQNKGTNQQNWFQEKMLQGSTNHSE